MAVLRSKTWVNIPDNISISQLMNENAFNCPHDKIIYEEAFTGKTKTYGEFLTDVKRAAYHLRHSLGLKPGQILSIAAPSCIDYLVVAQATWWAGGVVSLINNSLHETEIAKALDLIRPDYLVIHDSLWDKIPLSLAQCEERLSPTILTLGGKHHASWPSFPPAHHEDAGELEPYSLEGKDPKTTLCGILLSSGTTGRPKGVMLSHYNLIAALYQLRGDNPSNWRPSQREIFFPPLSHVYALYVCITGVFWLGAYACLMPRFDLERYCQLLQDREATLARMVPPIAKQLAEQPVVRKYKYPKLEYFSCSAAPLNVSLESTGHLWNWADIS
jgi:acyl-CoA synthetase (AMP-forming)/AMP-acid ligase II